MFTLKQPAIYDWYEGEDEAGYSGDDIKWDLMTGLNRPLANIFRASWQKKGSRVRGIDTRAVAFVAESKARGIKNGLFHFLTPNGIAEQAALFLSQWNKVGGVELPPIVDVEVDLPLSYPAAGGGSTIGNAVWQGHIKTFLDLIAAGTGRTPMIYTSVKYWQFVKTKQGILQQLTSPTWTKDYPLWVAQYPDYPSDTVNAPAAIPAGWTQWAIWQYHDKGRTNGFLANDLNLVSDWYAAELGAIVVPPPDPEPEPTPVEWPEKLVAHKGNETKEYFHA